MYGIVGHEPFEDLVRTCVVGTQICRGLPEFSNSTDIYFLRGKTYRRQCGGWFLVRILAQNAHFCKTTTLFPVPFHVDLGNTGGCERQSNGVVFAEDDSPAEIVREILQYDADGPDEEGVT